MSATAQAVELVESMHPEDVPEPIRQAAKALLDTTIPNQAGRTFRDAEAFGRCLFFLAVLTDSPTWDFLRGG